MAFYPIIMCGGAGTRLWPASRPSRPKQFIALAGNRSLFQDTALRVASLVDDEAVLVVIAGVLHRGAIEEQLRDIGINAQVLLEPEPRDSAAAMAAAALWVRRRDPEAIIAFVASDHYIPDAEAFRGALRQASEAAAMGQIVTLGVMPSSASSAYGYIKPERPGLAPVVSFHEKPTAAAARGFIDSGYLWNSGNFIVSAKTLLEELARFAPAVLQAAEASLPPEKQGEACLALGEEFRLAPKISIDYALMERTSRASVLEVDFAWSDLGSWDAVAASGEGAIGAHIFEDSDRILARAPDGCMIAAIGVSDLAIIVEDDAVLVCAMSRAQDVKRIVDRLRVVSPRHLDFPARQPDTLEDSAGAFAEWLRLRALPVWATIGLGADGGFAELLGLDGRSMGGARRARVQARQIFVYAEAGSRGWPGPWKSAVSAGLQYLRANYTRSDGMIRSLIAADGTVLDDTATTYDQAFVLLAMASARRAGIEDPALENDARALRDLMACHTLSNGAYREAGDHPFQSNAHMHLLEASLAWEAIDAGAEWRSLSDRLVELALTTFIDRRDGFLREFFTEAWDPAAGQDGRLIEPGHQFEWAWLMVRYGLSRGNDVALAAARTLYAHGRRGLGQSPPVALDAMNADGAVRSFRARLWPQTEWLKASLILAEISAVEDRAVYLQDAAAALRALKLYLTDGGLWRDKRFEDGTFLDEPAPASSFYHIIGAFNQMASTLPGIDPQFSLDLVLS